MKIYVFIALFTICLSACTTKSDDRMDQKSLQKVTLINDFSIESFKQKNILDQSEYINQLYEKDRIQLLEKLFSSGGYFQIPPNSYIKFLNDGKVIFDWDLDSSEQAGLVKLQNSKSYYSGEWVFKENKIIIKNLNDNIPFVLNNEEWFKVEAVTNKLDALLTLKISRTGNTSDILLTYVPDSRMQPQSFKEYPRTELSTK